jgi:mRNA guanylyltransferase
VYVFDRDNNPFHVERLHFPHRKHTRHLRNTLLDGEMIVDKLPSGESVPRYLIYDAVRIDDEVIRILAICSIN